MITELAYKHPNETLLLEYDVGDELPDDNGIASATVNVKTSSGGLISDLATVSTVTTSTEITITFVGGSAYEDYIVTAVAIGASSSKKAVAVVEVRVRENSGLGAV